jgi:hypothetical protein
MIRRFQVLLFASSAILAAAGANSAAAGESIFAHVNCPVPAVTRVVSGGLSSGWKASTLKGALASTKVQTSGGKVTLACDYGAAGTLTTTPAPHFVCTAVTSGFDCHIPGPPPPPNKIPGG